MIQKGTLLKITDNSGVKEVKCIQVLKKKQGSLGDLAVVSVQKLDPKKGSKLKKIKKGEIFFCLIVRTKVKFLRQDGCKLKFLENSGVLLNNQFNPLGSRSTGPTIRELRKHHVKILSTFEKVI